MRFLKKALFGLGCICLLALGMSAKVDAAESGFCGDPNVNGGKNVTWTKVNVGGRNVVNISGSGRMADFSTSGEGRAPWFVKSDSHAKKSIKIDVSVNAVVIGEGITYIGTNSFEKCAGLGKVSLPAGLDTIGEGAFAYCVNLGDVQIPESVKNIGPSAFKGCQKLSSLSLSGGLESIGNNAFNGCASLGEVTIPATVTSVGSSAFEGCVSLKAAKITGPLANLGGSAFKGCTGLTAMVIPSSIRYLNASTFEGCTGLKSVQFVGNYLWTIGYTAFSGCTSLTDITLPESLKSIEKGAFNECTALEGITIPGNIETLKQGAFPKCYNLQTMALGSGITTIESGAVVGCPRLTTVIIPKSLKTFGAGAFTQCGLTKINYVGKKNDWKKVKGTDAAFAGRNPEIKYGYKAKINSVTISDKTLTLVKNESAQLLVNVNPAYTAQKIEWSTSNFRKVNVNTNGYVTAYKPGKVTITVKCGSKKATCKVTVTSPVTSLNFKKEAVSLKVGKKATLKTKIEPSDATEKKLTYSVADESIASITGKGVVKGLKPGTTTVTATAPSGKTATCTITVE